MWHSSSWNVPMVDLVEHTCGECGCVWGFPAALKKQRLEDGKQFFCPNGHRRSFTRGQGEADLLRRERDSLKQQTARLEDRIRDERGRAERERHRANGYKGHATKMTKRAKAGVCPCCNRTFQQLARHMAAKHPQFTPIEIEQIGATVQ